MLVGRRSGPRRVTSRPSISTRAGRRRDEAADHAQQRGLAAARRAEDGEEVAALDVEVERPHRCHRP